MKFMDMALIEARRAYETNEVPVGAVIASGDKVIASARNTSEKDTDCTCHAEMNVIRKAQKKLNTKHLDCCDMYVTVEPCAMCAAAIAYSKIKRLYIGAAEPKTGCVGSVINLYKSGLSIHVPEIYEGIGEEESKNLMKSFFDKKR